MLRATRNPNCSVKQSPKPRALGSPYSSASNSNFPNSVRSAMRTKSLAVILGVLSLTGCYHLTVVSGTSPAPTVVDKPWQNSFVYGLVPPPELNVKEQCPNGVQKVETEI